MSHSSIPTINLAEIRSLLTALPSFSQHLKETSSSFSVFQDLRSWLSVIQNKETPVLQHPRVTLFAGTHGFASKSVIMAIQEIHNLIKGRSPLHAACEAVDADLRVYELDLEHPTQNITLGPAMSDEDCARAIAYGMMAVEPGIHVLTLGAMGEGSLLSAKIIALTLLGGSPESWEITEGKDIAILKSALATNSPVATDPLSILQTFGGFEIAAIIGAILAARMGRVPVILEGFSATIAAAVLQKIKPEAVDHVKTINLNTTPAGCYLQKHMALQDIPSPELKIETQLGLRAALAIPLLKTAARLS